MESFGRVFSDKGDTQLRGGEIGIKDSEVERDTGRLTDATLASTTSSD